MAKKVEDVGVEEYADQWGITRQRVHQLIQQGMPHRQTPRGSRIVPREANRWRLDRALEDERQKAKQGKEPTPRERLELADANLKEMTLAERRRELLPAGEVSDFLQTFVGEFNAVANGQLQRFERDIVHATSPADARRLVERIRSALMTGARDFADTLAARATEAEQLQEIEAVADPAPDPATPDAEPPAPRKGRRRRATAAKAA